MAVAIGICPKTICNIEKGYYCPTLEQLLGLQNISICQWNNFLQLMSLHKQLQQSYVDF